MQGREKVMFKFERVFLVSLATLLVSASLSILLQPSVAYQLPNSDHGSFTLNFLENVIGFTDFEIISFSNSTTGMIGSQQKYTSIGISIGIHSRTFEAVLTLVNNKLWQYDLDLPSDSLFEEKTFSDCLVVANRTIERYRRLLDADHCDRYSEMISIAAHNQSLTVENDEAVMKISYQETLSTSRDFEEYVLIEWLPKFRSQTPTRYLATYMSVSKNGLVTSIVDNSAINYIAALDNMSMKEAIGTAIPYAETYAEEYGQEIVLVNTTLVWSLDLEHRRGGDESALYPIWDVKATYNKVNEEGVACYGVAIWADTGEVCKYQPILPQKLLPPSRFSIDLYVVLGVIAVSTAFLILSGFKLYRRHNIRTKVCKK